MSKRLISLLMTFGATFSRVDSSTSDFFCNRRLLATGLFSLDGFMISLWKFFSSNYSWNGLFQISISFLCLLHFVTIAPGLPDICVSKIAIMDQKVPNFPKKCLPTAYLIGRAGRLAGAPSSSTCLRYISAEITEQRIRWSVGSGWDYWSFVALVELRNLKIGIWESQNFPWKFSVLLLSVIFLRRQKKKTFLWCILFVIVF